MKLIVIAAAAAAIAGPAAAADTAPADTAAGTAVVHAAPRIEIVRVADLDLDTARGRATLDRRLWRAADRVCTVTSLRDLWEQREVAACRAEVLARVRPTAAGETAARGFVAVAAD